ncbi:PD-(D/E)XK nuclease family protein [Marinobacter hydrocarbonoclasticus]|nr:PD-(D/E)XK nuclease family protein [Marinobacter nauticus]
MEKITKESLSLLWQIISDPEFSLLSSKTKKLSLFDSLELDAQDDIRILSWLLNPNEGHGQHDLFIRALFSAVVEQQPLMAKTGLVSSLAERPLCAFQPHVGILAQTGTAAARLDLMLLDHGGRRGICLIRAEPAEVDEGRLHVRMAMHREWIAAHYPDWQWCCVVSGVWQANHGSRLEEFVCINDDWIVQTLDTLISAASISPQMEWVLRDLRYHVFGQWSTDYHPCFNGYEQTIRSLKSKHLSAIKSFESLGFHGSEISVVDCDPIQFYANTESDKSISFEEQCFIELWQTHYSTLMTLYYYDELALWEAALIDCFGQNIHIETWNNTLFLTHARFTDMALEQWPCYLEVTRFQSASGDSGHGSVDAVVNDEEYGFAPGKAMSGGRPDWRADAAEQKKEKRQTLMTLDESGLPDLVDRLKPWVRQMLAVLDGN